MTSKNIAEITLNDIQNNCNTALGYGLWQGEAEAAINDMFHVARTHRKSVTAVTKEFVSMLGNCGDRESYLLSCAIGKVLGEWLAYKWLKGYEIERARFMLRQKLSIKTDCTRETRRTVATVNKATQQNAPEGMETMYNTVKEQQIAELEKDLLKAYGMTNCHTSNVAEWLYHAGYRKEPSQVQQQTERK